MATKTNTAINGKEYYRITRTVGHKNGKPVKKQFYGSSKGDAERRYKEFLQQQVKPEKNDDSTLHDRAIEFIDGTLMVSQKYAEGTKGRYESAYRCHIDGTEIDHMRLIDIRPSIIQQYYNNLVVSKATLKNIHKFMSAFFKWCALNDYCENIAQAVTLPIKEENKRHDEIVVWTDEELHILNHLNFDHRATFLIKVLSYTGMRISEALALKYNDIDGDVIHLSRQHYLGELKPPKYNSIRDIPMHDVVKDALAIHREWQEKDMKKYKYKTDFIFTTSTGSLYEVASLRKSMMRLYKKIGIPYKHFHTYRSTFCTNMCRCGVPLEVTSAIMGHKSLEVTAKFYALIDNQSKADAIKNLTTF